MTETIIHLDTKESAVAAQTLTDADFRTALDSNELVIVDFFATWCGQCMLMKPKFQKLSDELPHVRFFIVDGEAAPEARKTVEIPNLPYFAFYKNGQQVDGLFTTKIDGLREKLEEVFGKAPSTGDA
jgi:thiol-disulfide isomerase/thioredoxin